MLIISQNLTNYGIPIPDDVIFRINLAWVNSLDELKDILKKHHDHRIFLDLPVGRIKPPNNKYTLEELVPIIQAHNEIRYFAISNVESRSDLEEFVRLLPRNIIIVPKIESPTAITNIGDIVSILNEREIVVMLDHDDLFSAIIKRNEPTTKFKEYITGLVDFCQKNNITLLRTVGVIFSDAEKRVTEYMK